MLYKLKSNSLPILRSMVKGLVIIAEEESGIPVNSNELFYYKLAFKIRNFSKTDIITIKFLDIEVQINEYKKIRFVINSEGDVIIHQNRNGDVPNLDEYIEVYIHLYNNKINFKHDKDATFKLNYEITTALGYTYSCVNIISFSKKDKKFSKISFANSIPLV